ncbi:MAG: hypothetical protein WCG06_03205 [Candidatus Omnitrophota bacterium]
MNNAGQAFAVVFVEVERRGVAIGIGIRERIRQRSGATAAFAFFIGESLAFATHTLGKLIFEGLIEIRFAQVFSAGEFFVLLLLLKEISGEKLAFLLLFPLEPESHRIRGHDDILHDKRKDNKP